jgi:hypothetical protein
LFALIYKENPALPVGSIHLALTVQLTLWLDVLHYGLKSALRPYLFKEILVFVRVILRSL